MIIYIIKLILILVFNIGINTYYINSGCKCCDNTKPGGTGSGSKGNFDILHGGDVLEKGDLGGTEQEQEEEGGEASDDDEHVEEQEEKQEQKQEGEEQDQNNEEQGENHEEEELNNNKVEEEKEHEWNEEYNWEYGGEENGYGDNQNENNKTEPENAQQEEEVIDVAKLESVVFTLSENNGGTIKINNLDKRYIKADFDAKNIVNPLFKDYVWVYKITKELYNSINEDSKIVFTYKSENNQNDPEYIFCAVKLTDNSCFLMVCTDGNSISVEGEEYTYGLFDATYPYKKGFKCNFLSEEFKMISCGRGIYNMSSVFYNNTYLEKIIFLGGFNTENVTDMSFMFALCSSLTNLNLSKFNTEKVVNINSMFARCKKLNELNLSSFDKANSLKELSGMFEECFIGVNLVTSNKEINEEMDEVRNKKL